MFCFECGVPATCNHHVVPKSKGGTKTVLLCDQCHAKIHGEHILKTGSMTKAALQHKKANGEKTGGDIPFGHEVGTDGKKLVENKNEQKIIRLIESLKGKRYSNNGIAKALNHNGYRTKLGKLWTHVQIGRIIKRRNQAA